MFDSQSVDIGEEDKVMLMFDIDDELLKFTILEFFNCSVNSVFDTAFFKKRIQIAFFY